MASTMIIIESLHNSGYSDEFIAKALNFLREQPEALLDSFKSPARFIIDNEYLINSRPAPGWQGDKDESIRSE